MRRIMHEKEHKESIDIYCSPEYDHPIAVLLVHLCGPKKIPGFGLYYHCDRMRIYFAVPLPVNRVEF